MLDKWPLLTSGRLTAGEMEMENGQAIWREINASSEATRE